MPFKLLAEEPSESDLVPLDIYFDPSTGRPVETDSKGLPVEEEAAEKMTIYLAYLPSDTVNRIRDEIYSFSKDGTSVLRAGIAAERKLEAAVKKWDNVEDNGNPVKPTLKALRRLSPWVQKRILNKINDMNILTEEQELD